MFNLAQLVLAAQIFYVGEFNDNFAKSSRPGWNVQNLKQLTEKTETKTQITRIFETIQVFASLITWDPACCLQFLGVAEPPFQMGWLHLRNTPAAAGIFLWYGQSCSLEHCLVHYRLQVCPARELAMRCGSPQQIVPNSHGKVACELRNFQSIKPNKSGIRCLEMSLTSVNPIFFDLQV